MQGDDALEFFVRTLLAQTETIERPLADTLSSQRCVGAGSR
jgi:hypothetical protein